MLSVCSPPLRTPTGVWVRAVDGDDVGHGTGALVGATTRDTTIPRPMQLFGDQSCGLRPAAPDMRTQQREGAGSRWAVSPVGARPSRRPRSRDKFIPQTSSV